MRPAARLASRIGLPFRDLDLLEQALVHSSYLHEHPDVAAHNERLEYLGDSVINLVISDALYRRHPGEDEGTLSARRATIVSTVGLARLGERLGLGELLLLGEGEAVRSGRARPSLLASALEAVAGAAYLDLGFDPTQTWLLELAGPEIAADLPAATLKSPKSRLQELTQRDGGIRPSYRVRETTGPDHDRRYRVDVLVQDRVLGSGTGASRRDAETEAAADALGTLLRESPLPGPADSAGDLRFEGARGPATGGGDEDEPRGGAR